jgi:hypothetical protein
MATRDSLISIASKMNEMFMVGKGKKANMIQLTEEL